MFSSTPFSATRSTTPQVNLLAEQAHRPEHVVSQHEILDTGAHRYVVRAEDLNLWSEAAKAREDRLVTALGSRYPDGPPAPVDGKA